MVMDIGAASIELAQSKLSDQVGTALLAKGLKTAEEQGSSLLKMLGSAAPLPEGSGQNVDLFA